MRDVFASIYIFNVFRASWPVRYFCYMLDTLYYRNGIKLKCIVAQLYTYIMYEYLISLAASRQTNDN